MQRATSAVDLLELGRYRVRLAKSSADMEAARRLRLQAFQGAQAAAATDQFDSLCDHVLVETIENAVPVCCFRLLAFPSSAEILHSYSGQYYDLSGFAAFDASMLEVGRFCNAPDWRDPDILRLAWAAIAVYVDDCGAEMLFGCSSFSGTNPEIYIPAFARLAAHHSAPQPWSPAVKAPEVVRFSDLPAAIQAPDGKDAKPVTALIPPLLRSYLLMGGWVSDHAVIDRAMNTMHVFTGVEIAAIPPARKRLLRGLARQAQAIRD